MWRWSETWLPMMWPPKRARRWKTRSANSGFCARRFGQHGAHVGGLGAEQGRLEQRLLDGPVGLLAEHAQDRALEERVGVVDGGHLRGGDDDLLRRDQEEVEGVEGHAGADVQDHHRVDRAQLADQALLVGVGDVGRAQHRAAAGERLRFGIDVGLMASLTSSIAPSMRAGTPARGRATPSSRCWLAAPRSRSTSTTWRPSLGDGHGQVGGDDALAHAALAPGDADHLCGRACF